jgi:AcrR family transcriptional regulator
LFQVRARWSVPSPTCVVRARVPLGTVHYIFPTKEQLLRAVLEDVVEEISNAARASAGTTTDLDSAMRRTALEVWSQLVEAHSEQQLMQYELTMWALRTPGMAAVATWQYELYLDVLTTLWTQAAARAGVTLAIPAEQLARLFLAGVDGLILQYLTLGDPVRAKADLEALVQQMVRYADPQQSAT